MRIAIAIITTSVTDLVDFQNNSDIEVVSAIVGTVWFPCTVPAVVFLWRHIVASNVVIEMLSYQEYKKNFGVDYWDDDDNPNQNREWLCIRDSLDMKYRGVEIDATGYPIAVGDTIAVAVSQGDSSALRIGKVASVSDKGVKLELSDGGRKQTYKFFERMVVVR